MPDPAASRKLSRIGLYGPFLLLFVVIVAWSGLWLWARGRTLAHMDAAVERLGKAGYAITWKERRINGYPFRVDLTLIDARIDAPSGWGLETPRLEAEAYMHGLGHWAMATPVGLAFVRPEAGPVNVTGKLIHGSLFDLGKRPPSFDFEGVDLAFQSRPGASPFSLSTAGRAEFHLRAGPDDQGGVFANVENGKARPASPLARIADGGPIAIEWNSTLTKMSAFTGANWPEAVRRWTDAGGAINLRQAGMTAGEARIGAQDGTLTVGADGRLRGVINVTLRQAPRALGLLGDSGALPVEAARAAADVARAREGADQIAHATLDFQAGRTTLGPAAIGPAPKAYEAH